MANYYFKTTEVETITKEVVYTMYGKSEEEARKNLLEHIELGVYCGGRRIVEPLKSTKVTQDISECIPVSREYFMSDDEIVSIREMEEISHNLANMKTTHPDLYTDYMNEMDEGDWDEVMVKYYKLAFGRDIFVCAASENAYCVESGVMAEIYGEMQMCHKSEVSRCERCHETLVAGEYSECEDCRW